jgi:hypothetical protein
VYRLYANTVPFYMRLEYPYVLVYAVGPGRNPHVYQVMTYTTFSSKSQVWNLIPILNMLEWVPPSQGGPHHKVNCRQLSALDFHNGPAVKSHSSPFHWDEKIRHLLNSQCHHSWWGCVEVPSNWEDLNSSYLSLSLTTAVNFRTNTQTR